MDRSPSSIRQQRGGSAAIEGSGVLFPDSPNHFIARHAEQVDHFSEPRSVQVLCHRQAIVNLFFERFQAIAGPAARAYCGRSGRLLANAKPQAASLPQQALQVGQVGADGVGHGSRTMVRFPTLHKHLVALAIQQLRMLRKDFAKIATNRFSTLRSPGARLGHDFNSCSNENTNRGILWADYGTASGWHARNCWANILYA